MTRKPSGPTAERQREELDRELDAELEGTFPASDPPKGTRVPPRSQITGEDGRRRSRRSGKRLRDRAG
jgi:hypothetical protein